MRWTERQQALLREIGVRLWLPADAAEVPGIEMPATEMPRAETQRSVAAVIEAKAPPASLDAPSTTRPTASPPADGVAAMDWPQLRSAVAGCEACPLSRTRRNTVFGVGGTQAHWMVVGEAPGEQEDRVGEPFVGAAGQLLDRMLAALGLTRGEAAPEQQVFIANSLKCRPPRNRNPSPEELLRCQPFLERQVALLKPRIILAMGRFAVQSLLASDAPIGRLRGQVHQWQGVPLVVTYHPAYLLRQPADKARAWADLCLAAEVVRKAGADPAQ